MARPQFLYHLTVPLKFPRGIKVLVYVIKYPQLFFCFTTKNVIKREKNFHKGSFLSFFFIWNNYEFEKREGEEKEGKERKVILRYHMVRPILSF